MTPLEDGKFHKDSIDEPKGTTETVINISPNCTSSEDSDSPDEEPDAPEAVSDTQKEATGMHNAHARRKEVQKSVAEFKKSIAEHQSYFWDQEGLDQSNSIACPRLNITAVSEGEEFRDLLLSLENMDPCVDIDDPLPEQVNKFLEAFQKHLDQGNSREPPTGTVQIERLDQLEHPPTERESRKNTVRFKEAPKFMDSPILGQQPSRRSLFQTPLMAPVPFARSTPTQLALEQPIMLIGDEQKPEKDFPPFQSKKDIPLIRSPIYIRLPPFDLTPPLSEEGVMKIPEYHSILPKALKIAPSIRQEWNEPITYHRDNYAHFISKDCEPSHTILNLLIATDRVDPQELLDKRLRKEKILVTPLGKYKTYSIVIQRNHFDDTNWEDVWTSLLNFKNALERDQCKTYRMANSGDLLGALSQSRIRNSPLYPHGPRGKFHKQTHAGTG